MSFNLRAKTITQGLHLRASISIQPEQLRPGQQFTALIRGFDVGSTVTLQFLDANGRIISNQQFVVNRGGGVDAHQAQWLVPPKMIGSFSIAAVGFCNGEIVTTKASFTVNP